VRQDKTISSLQLMWIVKLALRRPYTFVVMALLILLLGITSIKKTPTQRRKSKMTIANGDQFSFISKEVSKDPSLATQRARANGRILDGET
jgi:hypothetical protein